jgi:glyoxylase-like metal-dependent hydrolase (beta-lactamase superfamily II)
MLRERVTEDVFVFISDLYAEVAATVIATPEGAVVVDTLPFPAETQQVREFALQRSPRGVRYVVNTHHHADHTEDGIMVHIREDKVLVASDLMTPVPLIVRGEPDQLIQSLKPIKSLNLENVIQGHGGVLLRGEIDETVDSSINYMRCVAKRVRAIVDKGLPPSELRKIDIEDCGKSRIPLGGLVQRLHLANLEYLYNRFMEEKKAQG